MRHEKNSHKFMQVLDEFMYKKLEAISKPRGITIQELLRAVTIPEWIQTYEWRKRALAFPTQTEQKILATAELLRMRRRRRKGASTKSSSHSKKR